MHFNNLRFNFESAVEMVRRAENECAEEAANKRNGRITQIYALIGKLIVWGSCYLSLPHDLPFPFSDTTMIIYNDVISIDKKVVDPSNWTPNQGEVTLLLPRGVIRHLFGK